MEDKLQKLEDQLQKTENIQLQLQNIDSKMQKVENEIQEQRSGQNEILAALQKLNVSELQIRNQEKLHTALETFIRDVERVLRIQNYIVPSSCKDILSTSSASQIYEISVKTDSEPLKVYCEQQAFRGGWIVIQNRYNGSLDFDRGWNEFRDGFGDLDKEFWLGLEKVHLITKARTLSSTGGCCSANKLQLNGTEHKAPLDR
uniref:Fibrinogen C-terminal domain-containing protein n=1 Tax=Anopheles albimanus TaxID=7167 RepID=A0A182F376_ANOAL